MESESYNNVDANPPCACDDDTTVICYEESTYNVRRLYVSMALPSHFYYPPRLTVIPLREGLKIKIKYLRS